MFGKYDRGKWVERRDSYLSNLFIDGNKYELGGEWMGIMIRLISYCLFI